MKKDKKKIIITTIIIIAIISIIAYCIYYYLKKNKKYTSINDFETAQSVIEYMESEYISESKYNYNYPYIIKLKFKYLPYNEDKTSNENYYNQMAEFIANVLKYKNFILDDTENNISVRVECDTSNKSISNIIINNTQNYFSINNTQNVLEKYTNVEDISLDIDSSVLKKVINNEWKYDESNFGTKDSYYDEYNIFFDEGIKVKTQRNRTLSDAYIGKNIFNLVFTSKYKEKVVNNLTVGTSLETVVNSLGQPKFGSVESKLIGYKSDKLYIFFTDSEISVYRVENVDKTEFSKIITKFISEKNSKNLANSLIEMWPDYDEYSVSNNSYTLKYILKGIKVQFNITNEHGLILYSDFNGKITEDTTFEQIIKKEKEVPKYAYIKNTSLIYENEMSRAFQAIDLQFLKQTNQFVAIPTGVSSSSVSLKLMALTDLYPSSELNVLVNTYEWIDEVNLVYSKNGNGIYIYNASTLTTKNIVKGNDKFNIEKYENGILTYDGKNIKIDL